VLLATGGRADTAREYQRRVGVKGTTPSVATLRTQPAALAHTHSSTDCAAPAVAPIAYHVTTSLAAYGIVWKSSSTAALETDDRYAAVGSVTFRLPVVTTKSGKFCMRSSMR